MEVKRSFWRDEKKINADELCVPIRSAYPPVRPHRPKLSVVSCQSTQAHPPQVLTQPDHRAVRSSLPQPPVRALPNPLR